MLLTKEIERTLIIEYWMDEDEYLQCLEEYLRCEILDGDNSEFVTEVLNEVHTLVVNELNERYRQQAEQQRIIEAKKLNDKERQEFLKVFKEVFADEDVTRYWNKDEEALRKCFKRGKNHVK